MEIHISILQVKNLKGASLIPTHELGMLTLSEALVGCLPWTLCKCHTRELSQEHITLEMQLRQSVSYWSVEQRACGCSSSPSPSPLLLFTVVQYLK